MITEKVGMRSLLAIVALVMTLAIAACGGSGTATPTATAPSGGNGGTSTPVGDDLTEAEFMEQQWEISIPSDRFFSWSPVTIKRVIEENLPNVTLTLVDESPDQTFVRVDERPERKATDLIQHSPKRNDVWRSGGRVFPDNVPLPPIEDIPMPMWGIYPYSQMQIIALAKTGINSVHDLDGKSITMGNNPEDFNNSVYKLWFETAGVKPREIYTTEVGSSVLMEESADAATSGVVFQLTTSGDYIQLQTTKQIRFIDFDIEMIQQMREANPEWNFMQPVVLCNSALRRAMNLDYDIISPDYRGTGSFEGENCNVAPGGHSVAYAAFPQMPAELTYQMTKVVLENIDEVAQLYPGAPWVHPLWAERFAHFSDPQEFYHPGAVRAFEEAGLTYGQEGVEEWYSQRTDPKRWWLDYMPEE